MSTFLIHNGTHIIKSGFDTEKGAKTSLTRKWKKKYPEAQVSSYEYFNTAINHMVTVKNLLSGLEYQIRASDVGGCCDPSTERYHCM